MLFIVRGKLLAITVSGKTGYFKDGDFFGDELINWALYSSAPSAFPTSTRTVQALTDVEAFALTANDLKIVVSQFWWHFSKMLRQEGDNELALSSTRRKQASAPLETMAAAAIQGIWRQRRKRNRVRFSEETTEGSSGRN